MGLKKEIQALFAASVFTALTATFGRYFVTGYLDNQSWMELVPNGILTCIFLLAALVSLDIWHLKPANSHTQKTLLIQYAVLLFLRLNQPYVRWWIWKTTMNPKKINEKSLLHILRRSQNSEYGRLYKFSEMKSVEDFVRMHPITSEEHYKDYMDRMVAGEENVLFTGENVGLISTSGTTGRPKIYALSKDHLQSIQAQMGPLFLNTIRPLMNLQRMFTFHIHSPLRKTEGGVTIGAGTQLMLQFPPFNLIPKAYSKLRAEDAAYYAQAVFSLADRELRFIYGFSADLMYSYWKFMGERWENLCEDISSGQVGQHISMPEDIREELSGYLKADPARAAELRTTMQGGIVGLARRIWPDMEFLVMGKSAAFKMCANLLMENQLKGVKVIGFGHGATEAVTGLNFEKDNPHISEIPTIIPYPSFVEFIRLEDAEEQNPVTVFLEQLQVGSMYEVVHTTLNGLYRCRYGDVIKVVGFTNKTPKYEFVFKLGQRLNVAYERTPDRFLYDAIQECKMFLPSDKKLVNYTSTESISMEKLTGPLGKGHYVFFMEFDTDQPVSHQKMANEMDQALIRLYQPYKRFKDIDSIGPLRIIQVKYGTFEHLKTFIWSNPHTQFKMPRVQRKESALKYLLDQAVHS